MQLKRVYRQYDRGYSFTKEELYEKLEGPFWVAFDENDKVVSMDFSMAEGG